VYVEVTTLESWVKRILDNMEIFMVLSLSLPSKSFVV
jgi:hypothetical protein